ncbi:MAG: hypothetical protein II887_08170 [Bacteroidales bacterium]|nr:hypothetical protein [Bacteroidales bacterium]
MKSPVKFILCILTVVVMFLPMAQEHLRLFDFKALTGVVAEDPKPKVTLKHFTNQRLQRWTESHLQLNYGFREPLTRLYNQYRWDLFNQSNMLDQKRLFINDDGWIYESQHVEEYYTGKGRYYAKDSLEMAHYFGEEALRIYQLQQILESQGTHLFVMLLPGKEVVYPEHVPETDRYPHQKVFSATEFYHQTFDELGVNYIDVNPWFLAMKDTVDFPLYPQTGTHWSNYSALYVADSLIRYMEQLGDIKMEHFTIGEREERTVYPDDDLEQLMNLIRPLPKAPNYQAPYTIIEDSTACRPFFIAIGDSYFWNLANATPFGKIMGDLRYWYYFKTVYFDPDHDNIKDVDVMQEVLDADFVMLAYCTPQIYEMSQGFSQQLLLDICCNEEDFERAQKTLAAEIRKNPVWMELLVELANEYDFTIDTVVNGEAKNTILKRPSPYIPALRDTIPTKRSRKYTIAINRDNEEVLEMMEKIREDSLWYNSVVKQAEKRHLSAEDNLCLNAVYVLEKLKKK